MKKLIKIFLITLPVLYLNPAIGDDGITLKLEGRITGNAEPTIQILSKNCTFRNNSSIAQNIKQNEFTKWIHCNKDTRTVTFSISPSNSKYTVTPTTHTVNLKQSSNPQKAVLNITTVQQEEAATNTPQETKNTPPKNRPDTEKKTMKQNALKAFCDNEGYTGDDVYGNFTAECDKQDPEIKIECYKYKKLKNSDNTKKRFKNYCYTNKENIVVVESTELTRNNTATRDCDTQEKKQIDAKSCKVNATGTFSNVVCKKDNFEYDATSKTCKAKAAVEAEEEEENKPKENEFKLNVELTGPAESVILNLLSPKLTCVFKNNNDTSMEFYKTEKFKVVTCGTIPKTLKVSVSQAHTRWGIKEPLLHQLSLDTSKKDLSIKIETYRFDFPTNVSGTVTDATGETVIGAHVIFLDAAKKAISGTNYGAATDSDGNYSINSVPDNAKYIQVSSVGYNTEIRPLTKDSVYDIKLTEDAQVLEEVEAVSTNLNGKPCADDLLKKLNATKGTYTQHTETKKLYCNITKCEQHFETKNQVQDITYTVDGENSTQRQYMACSCKYETGADGTCTPPEKEEKIEVVPAPAPNEPKWKKEEIDAARDAAESARETENSDVNKLLGSVGMGATGIGGMMLMQGLSEKAADDDATRAMQAYISTFNCTYGSNRVAGGAVAEIPGGNELIALYSEYVNLANNLKSVKNELDMRAGIESEPILDSATSGLYDDVSVDGTSGAYASLARALMNPNGTDAAAWAEQTEKTSKNITTGAITAGAGAGVSMIGDLTNKLVEKKKAEKSTKSK